MLQETDKLIIRSSTDAGKAFTAILDMRGDEDKHKEMFYVMGLDAKNNVLFVDLIGIGTINQVSPHIREAFRTAIIKNAASIIVCHNHPSGNNKPSKEDDIFTSKLNTAGDLLSIKVLDHLIIGGTVYSYADNGDLK